MKRSVTKGIMYQAARSVSSQKYREEYTYSGFKLPDKKSITNYEIALEEAVPYFLMDRKAEFLTNLITDAKNNKMVPKEYTSIKSESYLLSGTKKVQNAKFSLQEKKCSVCLTLDEGSVRITKNCIKMAEHVKVNSVPAKYIEYIQNILKEIEEILSN